MGLNPSGAPFITTGPEVDGTETIADYAHGKVFVGQRQQGFAVNLGTIADLVNAPARFTTRWTRQRCRS